MRTSAANLRRSKSCPPSWRREHGRWVRVPIPTALNTNSHITIYPPNPQLDNLIGLLKSRPLLSPAAERMSGPGGAAPDPLQLDHSGGGDSWDAPQALEELLVDSPIGGSEDDDRPAMVEMGVQCLLLLDPTPPPPSPPPQSPPPPPAPTDPTTPPQSPRRDVATSPMACSSSPKRDIATSPMMVPSPCPTPPREMAVPEDGPSDEPPGKTPPPGGVVP
jgi:hypothetical protein